MNSYKVYSFDIFDTLLLRPFRDPQEVWHQLERQEHAKGFAKYRKKADTETYGLSSRERRETTIEEAYAIMPKRFRPLMQKEIDLERKVLRANPVMVEKWHEAGREGKTRVICSDMYLSREFLESVLRENGIDGWDRFYLSRDYNARKTTGELFKVMLKDLEVEPEKVLHIGDNKHSDVEVPQRLRINTFYINKTYNQFHDICPFVSTVNDHLAGTLAVGWNKFCYEHPEHTYWNRLGFIMGGVLGYMYVEWIVQTAQKLGKKRLLFIARDGYVLQKICNALYPDMETDYIYAPRMVSVAVNGIIGIDKDAVVQRQKYLDTNLKGADRTKIREEYIRYIKSLHIDDSCALIDGCSSAFSAQRLVEECLGREVFTFYLLAMDDRNSIGALYSTSCGKYKFHSLPFQMLSEFLFGAPEAPICDLKDCKPIYTKNLSEQEAFKLSVAEMIAEGAVACARTLLSDGVEITADGWRSYCDAFMNHLTDEDMEMSALAQNAPDLEQKIPAGVIYVPRKKRALKAIVFRGLFRGFMFCTYDKDYTFYINRTGLHFKVEYFGCRSKVVSYAN